MEEHHSVVEAANVCEEYLAFGGAEHISLVEDTRSSKVTVLKDKPVTGIVRKVADALKQCWRTRACHDIAGREKVTFLPLRQHSALVGGGVVAEEVTAAGDAADLLADCDALIRVLVFLARDLLGPNNLLVGRFALTNAEVAAVSSKDCCHWEQKYDEEGNPHRGGVDTSVALQFAVGVLRTFSYQSASADLCVYRVSPETDQCMFAHVFQTVMDIGQIEKIKVILISTLGAISTKAPGTETV